MTRRLIVASVCIGAFLSSGCYSYPGDVGDRTVSWNGPESDREFASKADAEMRIAELEHSLGRVSSSSLDLEIRKAELVSSGGSPRAIALKLHYAVAKTTKPGKLTATIKVRDVDGNDWGTATLAIDVLASKSKANALNGGLLLLFGLIALGLGVTSIDEAGPFAVLLVIAGALIAIGGLISLGQSVLAMFE
jgi:hypothetical protein